jgi:hypothetical protein
VANPPTLADPATPLTVAEVLPRLGLKKTDSVLALIHGGHLRAFDVSAPGSKRRTWRVHPADVGRFLESRQAVPAPKMERRAKAKRPKVTAYF